ncbi:MAG: hypothetical protein NCW75_09590 [Phycisphaera sp.]|nr:MAG: hypothetical protein NCW75_09590 [Phycisphaera sp.]
MSRILIGCASVASALAVVQPAFGQFGGGGGFGGADGPQVNREQLEDYADILGLDADQREIAQIMLEEYIDSVQTSMDEVREAMRNARQEFEETRDGSAFQNARELSQASNERAATLESQLMGDLQMMLTPEQAEAWPRVEMAHRRATTLPRGLMSGERVDLFEIVDTLELDGEPASEASMVLADYELALDRVLIARNEMFEEGLQMFRDRDFESLQDHFEKARDASVRVRDTHRNFARRLQAVIPEEKLPAMQTAVRRASFPTVYRQNRADRAIEAARGLDDLSDDQRSQINGIAESTARRMDQVNRKLADTIESNEVNMNLRDMMRGGRRGNEDGTRELFREKRDAVNKTVEQLKAVLTEEQAAKLDAAVGTDEDGEGRGDRARGQRGGDRQPQRTRQREF